MSSLIAILMLLLSGVITTKARDQNGISRQGNVLSFTGAGRHLRLELCTPSMVRIRESRTNSFVANEPWMVIKYQWDAVTYQLKTTASSCVITTNNLRIAINRKSLWINVYDAGGRQQVAFRGNRHSAGSWK